MDRFKNVKNLKDYQIYEEVGRGSFGQIFRIQKNGISYALKIIEKYLILENGLEKYVQNEAAIMKKLNTSDNILKIYDFFENQNYYFFILEYCEDGTLLNYVSHNKPSQEECLRIFIQLLKGFQVIHQNRFLHRDLKLDNILIQKGVFKIADFGLSKPSDIGMTYCGTTSFMAPEILKYQYHDYKVDIWSLGVILFFMCFRCYPFKSKMNLLKEIQSKCTPYFDTKKFLQSKKIDKKIDPLLQDLFKRIFVFYPQNRISFSELYKHKIFEKYLTYQERVSQTKMYEELESQAVVVINEEQIQICQSNQIHENSMQESMKAFSNIQKQLQDDRPALYLTHGASFKTFKQIENDEEDENHKFQNDLEFPLHNAPSQLNNQPFFVCIEEEKEECNLMDPDETTPNTNLLQIQTNIYQKKPPSTTCQMGPKFVIPLMINSYECKSNEDMDNSMREPTSKATDSVIPYSLVSSNKNQSSFGKSGSTLKSSLFYENYLQVFFERIEEEQFHSEIRRYKFEIERYHFVQNILEIYNMLQFSTQYRALIYYTISRLSVVLIKEVYNSIKNERNIYGLEKFHDFLTSKSGKLIAYKLNTDLNRWTSKRNLFYYSLDLEHEKANPLYGQFIVEDSEDEETFDSIKTQFRNILNQVFKQSIMIAVNSDEEYSKLENYRISLYTLIVLVINKVSFKKIHNIYPEFQPKEQDYSIEDLKKYIDALDSKQLVIHLLKIVSRVFGSEKYHYIKQIITNPDKK